LAQVKTFACELTKPWLEKHHSLCFFICSSETLATFDTLHDFYQRRGTQGSGIAKQRPQRASQLSVAQQSKFKMSEDICFKYFMKTTVLIM
jgi:hypothetical protein